MSKPFYQRVAKCSSEKACNKCSTISPSIVIKRGVHYTLYCSKCGAYIKHASIDDRRYIYADKIILYDETPIKLWLISKESYDTMYNK